MKKKETHNPLYKKSIFLRLISSFIILIILISVLFTYKQIKYKHIKNEEISKIESCKNAVKRQLKSSSTAIFYDLIYDDYVSFGNSFVIAGSVDAMNGFGGYGRLDFICYKGKKDLTFDAILNEGEFSIFYETWMGYMHDKKEFLVKDFNNLK